MGGGSPRKAIQSESDIHPGPGRPEALRIGFRGTDEFSANSSPYRSIAMKNQIIKTTGAGFDNHAITPNGTRADVTSELRSPRKRKSLKKLGVAWFAVSCMLWLGSSVCAGDFKIWEQRRFRNPVEVTDPYVCDVGSGKACPGELGGWAMGEIAFRYNNYSHSGKFNRAKSVRLVVRTNLFGPMAVVVKVGNTKVGGFSARPGQKVYEVAIPKRLLRSGSNIRLITPSANVGYGNDFDGLDLRSVTLFGRN
jgi:hypothetical protein